PFGALTSGFANVALGPSMLTRDTSGFENLAVGAGALSANTTGDNNAAIGEDALTANTTGSSNVAIGRRALESNQNGQFNVALGIHALDNSVSQNDVGVGNSAGANLTTGGGNIDISNPGVAGEAGVIRIGTQGTQTKAFLAGVNAIAITGPAGIALTNSSGQLGTGTTGTVALPSSVDGATSTSGVSLLINSSGVLGTTTSSRRFKTDIHALGAPTLAGLMALRPVSFHYKARYRVGQPDPLEYGLIAEQVAKVDPSLAAYGNDGRPYTVRYQELPVLLLAEIQRQQRQIDALRTANRRLQRQGEAIASLQRRMARVERGI